MLAASAGALWLACDTINVQPFIAGQYLPALDCVTPGEAIDVIDGIPTDASCDAACIVPPYEAGVFVTGACAPFPPGDLVNPDSGMCRKALAAINRHDLCLEAGPSNPAVDAGAPPVVVDGGSARDDGSQGSLDAGKPKPAADAGRSHDATTANDAHD